MLRVTFKTEVYVHYQVNIRVTDVNITISKEESSE